MNRVEIENFRETRQRLQARVAELRAEITEIEAALGVGIGGEDTRPYKERRPGWVGCRPGSKVGKVILGHLATVEKSTVEDMAYVLRSQGVSRRRIWSAASSLCQQGCIERVNHGEYRISAPEDDLFGRTQ